MASRTGSRCSGGNLLALPAADEGAGAVLQQAHVPVQPEDGVHLYDKAPGDAQKALLVQLLLHPDEGEGDALGLGLPVEVDVHPFVVALDFHHPLQREHIVLHRGSDGQLGDRLLLPAQEPLHQGAELFFRHRLYQVIHRVQVKGLHGEFPAGGGKGHLDVGGQLLYPPGGVHAVSARQVDVQQAQVELEPALQGGDELFAAGKQGDHMGQLPLVQQRFQGGAQAVGLLLQVLASGDLEHPVFPPCLT